MKILKPFIKKTERTGYSRLSGYNYEKVGWAGSKITKRNIFGKTRTKFHIIAVDKNDNISRVNPRKDRSFWRKVF